MTQQFKQIVSLQEVPQEPVDPTRYEVIAVPMMGQVRVVVVRERPEEGECGCGRRNRPGR